MLQPLTNDLRFPFVEELVKSYGLYLEQLTKDDKYGLISALATWLREQADVEHAIGVVPVTEQNFGNLLDMVITSSTTEAILRKYMSQWNEPIMQSLIIALVQQLREGYYRVKEIDELEDIHLYSRSELPEGLFSRAENGDLLDSDAD